MMLTFDSGRDAEKLDGLVDILRSLIPEFELWKARVCAAGQSQFSLLDPLQHLVDVAQSLLKRVSQHALF